MDIVEETMKLMNIPTVLMCALEVVGLVQVVKNFFGDKKVPAWVFAILMVVVSILVTLAAVYLPPVVTMIILVVCVSQLGYETILQTIKKLVERVISGEIKPSTPSRY